MDGSPLGAPICGAAPALFVTDGNAIDVELSPVIFSTPPSVEHAVNTVINSIEIIIFFV
jgi:hypothetical protein